MSTTNLESSSFQDFFETWLSEQNQYLSELVSMAKANVPDSTAYSKDVDALIERVMEHYDHYYEMKLHWIEQDTWAMLKPSWLSSLEEAFVWLGGWRPSMAFHLLYSKVGLQLEGHLLDLIEGLPTEDLADLSPEKIVKIDTLQRETVKKEKEINEKMAKYQGTIADPSMVELAHAATESKRERGETWNGSDGIETAMEEKLKVALGRKEDGFKEMVKMGDELRLATLKDIIEILSKSQRLHFLIAAAELHLRVHEWGLHRDSSQPDKKSLSHAET